MNIIIVNEDDDFEDVIKINKADFDTQEEYQQFLRQVYKFEFNRFLIDADIVLDGETYNEALDMYIELDTNRCLDTAMDRIQAFNDFMDLNNKF